jgi:hypothetical protein
MSLFPQENILTKEIESWRVFADSLKSEEVKKLFLGSHKINIINVDPNFPS